MKPVSLLYYIIIALLVVLALYLVATKLIIALTHVTVKVG